MGTQRCDYVFKAYRRKNRQAQRARMAISKIWMDANGVLVNFFQKEKPLLISVLTVTGCHQKSNYLGCHICEKTVISFKNYFPVNQFSHYHIVGFLELTLKIEIYRLGIPRCCH